MKGWTTLVAAETLAIGLARPDVVIVDCRYSLAAPDAGEHAWLQARIPGARYAHLDRDLSGAKRPGEGRHPLPDEGAFCATLGRWGITPQTQVVAYDHSDGAMAAARLWWLLRLLGHQKVAVLDGGYARWLALGLPTETRMRKCVEARYQGRFDRDRIATTESVLARLGEPPGWLIDVRAPERFSGESESIDRRAGHVPGAVNWPYVRNVQADGRFRPPVELAAGYRALIDGRDPSEVVLMCGSGVTSCQALLAMERAGLRGARIYAGSWSGWIDDPARPIATGA
ncbi:MAG: sulfurtransferase [Rehaibacterium terrae]|uniref:sulfurtransferase n=1 Tax=Rehaibacterium terrae TaxID=1341696 RepID=UPI0039195325